MQRRDLIQKAGLVTAAVLASACPLTSSVAIAAPAGPSAMRFREAVQQIEKTSGGRLGVAVLDTLSSTAFGYRGGERFPMCSTFKFLAAAQVLSRVDAGQEQLDRRIAILSGDLVPYAPVTQPRVGGEPMTIAELCEAAVTLSDNVAGNLLLASLGGPQALTAYARSLGDPSTRLDRIEPDLNQAIPGDPRDTTTPQAMLQTLRSLVLGTALSVASRTQLTQWLVHNKTGDKKLRAALPAGWRVGDKTGAGAHGTNNDIAVIWPPGRAPLLVAAYLTETAQQQVVRDQALADVGRLVAAMVTDGA